MIELKETSHSDSNAEFGLLEDGDDGIAFHAESTPSPRIAGSNTSESVESHDFESYESDVYKHYQLSR